MKSYLSSGFLVACNGKIHQSLDWQITLSTWHYHTHRTEVHCHFHASYLVTSLLPPPSNKNKFSKYLSPSFTYFRYLSSFRTPKKLLQAKKKTSFFHTLFIYVEIRFSFFLKDFLFFILLQARIDASCCCFFFDIARPCGAADN